MRNFVKGVAATLFLAALVAAGIAVAQNVSNYMEQGGARWVIGGSLDVVSGGDLDIESGASLKIAGTAITSTAAELNLLDAVTASSGELNTLDGVTAVSGELNYLDITTLGTGAASKAVVLDAGEDYTWPVGGVLTYGAGAISATGTELDEAYVYVQVDGIETASATGYVVSPVAGTIGTIHLTGTLLNDYTTVFTSYIGATPITTGQITIASGTAAGVMDSTSPSAANVVAIGDVIKIESDGGQVLAANAVVTFTIAR